MQADDARRAPADANEPFASFGESGGYWLFERDPFFAVEFKDRAVCLDAQLALAWWASQQSVRRFEVTSVDGKTGLTAALVSHVTDRSAMSDLGHIVVRLGLMRHRIGERQQAGRS